MKNILLRAMFFLGWLLSPFTFWNDAFLNIPLSYICANLAVKIFPANFLFLVLVFYWLSNIVGVALMLISGKKIIKGGKGLLHEIFIFLTTIIAYSLILVSLNIIGVLRPFRTF